MASKTSGMKADWFGALLQRPSSMPAMVVGSFVVLLVGAVYCSGYEALTTGYDNWPGSLIWAAYALLPWYLLFEWIRRREHRQGERVPVLAIAGLLVAVGAGSLAAERLEYGMGSSAAPPVLLSLIRRAPGIAITLALIAVSRIVAHPASREDDRFDVADLLAKAKAIRWISAADNYLEIHYPGGVAMIRMTMREAERRLAPLGFVRIHRSIIVNRALVDMVESDRVRLDDGKVLVAGKAFAGNLRTLG